MNEQSDKHDRPIDAYAIRRAMQEFPSDMQSVGLLVSLKAAIRTYLACIPSAERDTELAEGVLKLTKTVRYLVGIAERGEGRPMRADETAEQFVLGYVKKLESAKSHALPSEPRELVRDARVRLLRAWEKSGEGALGPLSALLADLDAWLQGKPASNRSATRCKNGIPGCDCATDGTERTAS